MSGSGRWISTPGQYLPAQMQCGMPSLLIFEEDTTRGQTAEELHHRRQETQGLIVCSVRTGGTMTRLRQDLRYALRQLRRSPSFALTALVTLALGIGANVVAFGV